MTTWLLVWLTSLAAGGEPVTVPRVATSPVIDGRLDEPCWRADGWHTGFSMLDKPELVAPVQTWFQFAHDGEALYLAVRAAEPNLAGLVTRATARDGKVWNDDVIELMLDANRDRSSHLHIAVSAAGVIYDSEVRQGGHVHAADWNSTATAATGRTADAWTLELRLPLVELGLDEGSRGAWGFNLGRERYAGGTPERSAYGPTTGGFHQPTQFVDLTLIEAATERFRWEVRPPFGTSLQAAGAGLELTTKTYLTNQTGQFSFFRLTAEVVSPGAPPAVGVVTSGLDTGQGRELVCRVPLSTDGLGRVVLRLTVADRGTGQAVAVRQFPMTLSYSPLTVELLQPSYRNSIYATQSLTEVTGRVLTGLPASDLAGRELTVALLAGNDSLAETKLTPLADGTPYTLPVGELAVGEYQIRATLTGGPTPYEASCPLHKLPPVAHEWRIDEQQVVRYNGEPYLAFGWFSTSERLFAETAALGFNCLIDYNAYYRSEADQIAFLDAAHAAGLKVAFYPYPHRSYNDAARWGQPVSAEEEAAIRAYIDRYKHHPALLAWYMADEPELRPALPERAERLRQICAEQDPYHPCIMLNDTIEGVGRYRAGGDILMPDPYPLFLADGLAARSLSYTSRFMAAVNEASDGWRAAWITPQAFNYGDYGRLNNRAPNFAELRSQCYQAAIHGATGWLWYTFSHRYNYPAVRLGTDYLAREVRLLAPAILSPGAHVPLAAEPADEMFTSLRRVADHWYLFAAATATTPREVTLALPDGAPTTWYEVGTGAEVSAAAGRLSRQFAVYQTVILTTDRDLANAVSLAATDAAIAAAEATRRRPGNLAFEDHGTTVEVSSKSQYSSNPDRVNDGILDGMGWRDGTPDQFPDWLALRFPAEVTVGRVEVYSTTLAAGRVEYQPPGSEEWLPGGELTASEPGRWTARFDPVAVTALRVVVTASTDRFVSITEVEAYAR